MNSARLALLAFVISGVARSDDVSKSMRVIRASGEATVSVKPDRAELRFGVVTQAPSAEAAAAQNAVQTSQMLNAIKRVLGAGGDIKTSAYAVSPAYQNERNGAQHKIVGYNATDQVVATIDDLMLVSKVLDSAATAGANDIEGISFLLGNDQAARSEALAQAAAKARDSAEAIAKALNLHVAGVVEAETADVSNFRPQYRNPVLASAAQTIGVPTPIEAGNIDVSATVVVTMAVQ